MRRRWVHNNSIQILYLGRWAFLDLKLYVSFTEQLHERIVIILAKADKALDTGIDQHLGTEYAGGMGTVNCAPFKTHTMESRLDDYVLLGVDAATYLVTLTRGYFHLVSKATQFEAVLKPGRRAVVAGGQYMLIPDCYCPDIMSPTR
jgi:hypothetical protein